MLPFIEITDSRKSVGGLDADPSVILVTSAYSAALTTRALMPAARESRV